MKKAHLTLLEPERADDIQDNKSSATNMMQLLMILLGATFCVCEELRAICVIQPATVGPDATVKGVITFYQSSCEDDLMMSVNLEGFQPLSDNGTNTKHGFHIHEFGDISNGCGSTGGHYNPLGVNHGAPGDAIRHVGDFGNLEQTANGRILVNLHDTVASLFGRHSIIGRAVVLHRTADDLGQGGNAASLVNGNAGPRVGCCVIGRAKVG
ncbi:hypothetical protein RRG08_046901 [Elysia crispata]|uniref:Superoxide dismutase [Cu-Zn] n=1 Tax=Elysia crispata TaxID=231223 RepID=A0AAE0ZJA2_9GAST|nr:hypothetical protein RRG08_046901 [Elysia crispata]